MHFPHVHITAPEVEHGLDIVGRIAGGGAISNGAEALSDGQQQLDFGGFNGLMNDLQPLLTAMKRTV